MKPLLLSWLCSVLLCGFESRRPVAQDTGAGSLLLIHLVPKQFATLERVDADARTVHLRVEGESEARDWAVLPDAEVKVRGFWGRLDQLAAGDRVWVWFLVDARKERTGVLFLADEVSEREIHRDHSQPGTDSVRELARAQRAHMHSLWREEGVPGTLTFLHPLSGELEVMVDHEGMRWSRSLRPGDEVTLAVDPPLSGVVREVEAWRERTRLRLGVRGVQQGDLSLGQRVGVRIPEPPEEILRSELPPDLGLTRTGKERIDWFLASTYCTCSIGNDFCTGMLYTLASCDGRQCGMPKRFRAEVVGLIEEGLDDRAIFARIRKTRGASCLTPHLRK